MVSKANKIKLVIGLPFEGRYVAPEWALSLTCLAMPMNLNIAYVTTFGLPRDEAREKLVEEARKFDPELLLMIDDDTAPPNYAVRKLIYELEQADKDVMVIGGIYCSKADPPEPLVFQGEGMGPFWKWKVGEVFECKGIGTGCMMMKMEVFDKLKPPYFRDIKSPDQAERENISPSGFPTGTSPAKFEMTDDLYFCRKVVDAGYKILAHGGVLPIHWDQNHNFYVLPEGSYPVRGFDLIKKGA